MVHSSIAGPRKGTLKRDLLRDWRLYLLLLPGVLFLIIFRYLPMYGVVIAFQEFNMFVGIQNSPWVGLGQFQRLFTGRSFPEVFNNTLVISLLKLVWGYPMPIIVALLLNEVRRVRYKKIVQTVLYLPHFISWVILSGIVSGFLALNTGIVNQAIVALGGKQIDFLAKKEWFRTILVISDIYKGVGWGTIVYLAAISGVDAEQYEAAVVDGATKLRQMWHITLPSIRPVIVITLILSISGILNAGFEQIFLLYNPQVYKVADVIDTYVYRTAMKDNSYSLGAAAGLFKSVISLVLIVIANVVTRLLGEQGLW